MIYKTFIKKFNIYINLYFIKIMQKYIIFNNLITFIKKKTSIKLFRNQSFNYIDFII